MSHKQETGAERFQDRSNTRRFFVASTHETDLLLATELSAAQQVQGNAAPSRDSRYAVHRHVGVIRDRTQSFITPVFPRFSVDQHSNVTALDLAAHNRTSLNGSGVSQEWRPSDWKSVVGP